MGPSAIVTALIVLLLAAGQQAKPPARPREPLLTKLLRIAGLTAAPSQMRGPADDAAVGNIWMVSIDRRDGRALTTDGGYRSPIFLPNGSTLLALRGNAIVRLGSAGGNSSPVRMKVGVAKLVGVDSEDPSAVVVLLVTPTAGSPLASVSLQDGTATALPFDAADESQQRMLAQIRSQDRTYRETTVYTRTETKSDCPARSSGSTCSSNAAPRRPRMSAAATASSACSPRSPRTDNASSSSKSRTSKGDTLLGRSGLRFCHVSAPSSWMTYRKLPLRPASGERVSTGRRLVTMIDGGHATVSALDMGHV
jgi:hypothetical protein